MEIEDIKNCLQAELNCQEQFTKFQIIMNANLEQQSKNYEESQRYLQDFNFEQETYERKKYFAKIEILQNQVTTLSENIKNNQIYYRQQIELKDQEIQEMIFENKQEGASEQQSKINMQAREIQSLYEQIQELKDEENENQVQFLSQKVKQNLTLEKKDEQIQELSNKLQQKNEENIQYQKQLEQKNHILDNIKLSHEQLLLIEQKQDDELIKMLQQQINMEKQEKLDVKKKYDMLLSDIKKKMPILQQQVVTIQRLTEEYRKLEVQSRNNLEYKGVYEQKTKELQELQILDQENQKNLQTTESSNNILQQQLKQVLKANQVMKNEIFNVMGLEESGKILRRIKDNINEYIQKADKGLKEKYYFYQDVDELIEIILKK